MGVNASKVRNQAGVLWIFLRFDDVRRWTICSCARHNHLPACLSGRRISATQNRKNILYCSLLCQIPAQSHDCMSVTTSLADVEKIVSVSMRWTNFLYLFTLKIKLKHRRIMAHGAVAGGQTRIIRYKKNAEGGWDVGAPYKHLSHLTPHQVRSILSGTHMYAPWRTLGHMINPMKFLCEYTFWIIPSWKNFQTNAPHPKQNSRGPVKYITMLLFLVECKYWYVIVCLDQLGMGVYPLKCV